MCNKQISFEEQHVYLNILRAHSKVLDNFSQLKPFKNDGKCFLFHFESSFRSQDI